MAGTPLTPAAITALLAQGGYKRKRTSTNYHYARIDGILTKVQGKPSASTIGKFEGKVGTVTRSRKGATRRKPNGSRTYIAPHDNEVVMY